MNPHEKYEPIIGLEVHAQLLTKSKIFSSDSSEFGAQPNTQVSVVTLGHPGTLPKLNEKVIEFAVMMGVACHCDITRENEFSRKNYFYPDLPKGYQISQFTTPICSGGYVPIAVNGEAKKINLTRIHLEEDAGKSIHDIDPDFTLIDLNRAGTPLIEIVTEPELTSGDDAYQYLTEIRKLVRYLGICDGNMEEGSMRCDANVSVRLKGSKTLGTKVEVKNLNSIRNVKRAVEYEIERQIKEVENGNAIIQETRAFDAERGTTFSTRAKEMAHDYRYFPEPDLVPVIVTKEMVEEIKKKMPQLPDQLKQKFISNYGLPEYAAQVLTDEKELALCFENVVSHTGNYKSAANWVIGNVKSWLNENKVEMKDFPVSPEMLAELIEITDAGKISQSVASQKVFPGMVKHPGKKPLVIAEEMNLLQQSDVNELQNWIEQAVKKFPEKVKEYHHGKKGLVGFFMGEVMKLSKGKADPKVAAQLLEESLKKNKS